MRHVNIGASAAAVILFTCVPVHAQATSALPEAEILYDVATPESLALDLTTAFQQPAGPPPTPRHTGIKAMAKELVTDVKLLPSKENLMWAIIGGGLALAVHPADDNVNRALVGNTTAENFFKPGRVLGSLAVLMGSSVAVYATGRIRDQPRV